MSPNKCHSGIGCVLAAFLLGLASPLIHAQQQFLVAPQYAGGGYMWSAAVGDFNGDGKLDIVAANYGSPGTYYGTNSVSVFLGNGDGTFPSHLDYGVAFLPYAIVTGDFNGDGKLDVAVSAFSEAAGVCSNQCQSLVSILLGNGDGTFQQHIDFYSGGITPLNMASGDFNGDGKLDLVVSNSQEPGRVITVLLGNGDGTFKSPLNSAAGISLGSVVVADFNLDGKADLAVVSQMTAGGPTSLSVLLGKGDGTFQSPVMVAGVAPGSVAVSDLNGDGKPDLVVTDGSGVSVLLGNGDGTFRPSVSYTTPGAGPLVVEDFNGDGKPDLAVLAGRETVSVLFGNGDGTFQPTTDYVAGGDFDDAYGLVAGDFDGDKKTDLALVDGPASTATILLNNGTGGFNAARSFAAGNLSNAVALADLNGDGKLDLVVANGGDNTASVLLGNGNGTFSTHTDFTTGIYPDSIGVGDFDGDGKLDLVVSNGSDNTVSILLGHANGTFAAHADYGTGVNPVSVASGDFNDDGKLDVVTANSQSNSVSILLGNGDGTLKAHVDYATGLQPVSVAVADFNGDGKPDLAVAFNGDSFDQKTTPGGVDIFINRGDGTFLPPLAHASSGIPSAVAVGDFDGDGHADLVIANGGNSCVMYIDGKIECKAGASVSIRLGNGDGTFRPSTAYSTGIGPKSVTVADFNEDGKPDLVLANPTCVNGSCSGTTMSLLWGNGDGTFRPHLDYHVGSQPASLAAGDLNGDSRPDVVVGVSNGGWPGNGATVLLNSANGPGFILSATSSSTGPDFGGIVTSQPAQILCGVHCSAAYLPATMITLSAEVEPGYSFTGWGGDCTGTGPCQLNMTMDRAVDAMFSANTTTFTLTINTAGSGTGKVGIAEADAGFQCPSQCSFSSASGSVLNLGVVPGAGSTFGGWSGGGCAARMIDCSVTLNSDVSVTATFNGSTPPPPPDFSLSASILTPSAVSPGGQAVSKVAFSALNGFNSSVSLTCSVSPMPQLAPLCSLNPGSLQPGNSSSLTITTTSPSSAAASTPSPPYFRQYGLFWILVASTFLAVGFAGRRRNRAFSGAVLIGFLLTGIVFVVACAGKSNTFSGGGTPSGTYTITVAGTSGSIQHSTTMKLTVQ